MNKGNERHSMMNFLVLWIFSYIICIWQSIIRISVYCEHYSIKISSISIRSTSKLVSFNKGRQNMKIENKREFPD